MNAKLKITTSPYIGRRINATPESDIPEEVLLELAAAKKADRTRKRSRALAVWSAILLWLPFVLPLVYFIYFWFYAASAPLIMYPLLVLTFRVLANVGSLLLYLTARAANAQRKVVGWLALALFIIPIITLALMGPALFTYDFEHVSKLAGILALITLALTLLNMVALNVFSILLLKRVFPRRPKTEPSI